MTANENPTRISIQTSNPFYFSSFQLIVSNTALKNDFSVSWFDSLFFSRKNSQITIFSDLVFPKIYIYQLLDFVGSPYETHLAITN